MNPCCLRGEATVGATGVTYALSHLAWITVRDQSWRNGPSLVFQNTGLEAGNLVGLADPNTFLSAEGRLQRIVRLLGQSSSFGGPGLEKGTLGENAI